MLQSLDRYIVEIANFEWRDIKPIRERKFPDTDFAKIRSAPLFTRLSRKSHASEERGITKWR